MIHNKLCQKQHMMKTHDYAYWTDLLRYMIQILILILRNKFLL